MKIWDSVYIWSSLTWIASFKSCQILSTNFSSIVIGNARILILPSFFGMVFFIMVKPPDCLLISQKNSHKNVHFNLVVHSPFTISILACSARKIQFVLLKIYKNNFNFSPFSIGREDFNTGLLWYSGRGYLSGILGTFWTCLCSMVLFSKIRGEATHTPARLLSPPGSPRSISRKNNWGK